MVYLFISKLASMSRHGITIAVILFFVSLSLAEENLIVKTSLGKVRGHYKKSYGGRKFAAFEGIPYAKPPIGDLRFEEPIEGESWMGIWDANIVHTCLQPFGTGQPIGSEDCLYLNVYVPEDKLNDKSNLDVLVHMHGGSFLVLDPNIAGPGYLMDRNVLYVSMSYRLGPLGFLSTGDNVVPGNMGLKDQTMALRWVQKNIKSFGGNKNSVTLIGSSAGAASVHFHYFSSLSKGLFHRGISQGGTALAPWAIHTAPLKEAKLLATFVGCDNVSTKELIRCLKNRSARQIIQHSRDSPIDGFPATRFPPVIENTFPGAFLTDLPYKLLKTGNITDVPWITGATTEEGILGIMALKLQYDDLNERWSTVLPYILNYNHIGTESDKMFVAQRIKEFYLNGSQVTENNVQSLIKLFSDRYFYLNLEKSVRLQTKVAKSPVYSFIFGYKVEKRDEKFDQFFGLEKYGVGHASDAYFLYTIKFAGFNFPDGKLPKSDERIKELLLDFVTSFSRDGKPISNGITWEPVGNSNDFPYLLIHNDKVEMDSKNELAPREFWQSLPLQEYDSSIREPSKDEL